MLKGLKTPNHHHHDQCCVSLFIRYLDDNLIETIGDKVFDKLGSLLYLHLQNNQLTYFNTMPAIVLGLLDLSSNNIETIGYDAFTSLSNLQYL